MASQAELARLDQAHRQQQSVVAQRTVLLILTYWALVDPDDVAGTGQRWLTDTLAAVVSAWQRSANLAIAYAESTRNLQVPGERASVVARPQLLVPDAAAISSQAPWTPPKVAGPALAPNLEAMRKSLTYTGLANLAVERARLPRQLPEDEEPAARVARQRQLQRFDLAKQKAGAAAGAAAVRHVRSGEKAVIDDVVKRDKVARGWVRITRDSPCHFCAMLASRGPVYKGESFEASDPRFTGPGDHKVHDDCGCSLRPVYTRSMEEWPENSLRFDELWRQSTGGVSGKEKMRAFRRAYDAQMV